MYRVTYHKNGKTLAEDFLTRNDAEKFALTLNDYYNIQYCL
jgi:hypothetical protein